MGSELLSANHLPGVIQQLLPSLGPVLLISISYLDPGKWAASIEGGARFGIDLLAPTICFNIIAIFCQYLSARIGLITRKDLAQICSDEYDKWTCMFLGVQAMISVVALDLTMILGIAHGLNLLLGVDLSACVFLTAVDAVLFPLFSTILEKHSANVLCILLSGFLLLLCFLGVFISQPEVQQLSINGVLTRLNGETAYALMSLLGATIMPHNFYLHSSMVMQQQVVPGTSVGTLLQHHLFAIVSVFGGISLVNYALINSASNVFYNSGLVLLTFPDALSLIEQVFRGPVAPLAFLLILYVGSQITALTWNLHGQVVLHGFLGLDIPSWLQRATIRIIAIAPALFCVWTSGVEGLYQLLVFAQVIIAVLLPSSVIPLFRVASSRALMGSHKISQFLEFLAIVAIMVMLGLKFIFVVEMIFGDSDWIGNLRWSMGSSSSVPYIVLLVTACSSLCLMIWLAATPLKSATQVDGQVWNWDVQNTDNEPSEQRGEFFFSDTRRRGDEHVHEQEISTREQLSENYSDIAVSEPVLDLPETIMQPHEQHLTTIEEDPCDSKFPSLPKGYQEEFGSVLKTARETSLVNEVCDDDMQSVKTVEVASTVAVGKTTDVVADFPIPKEDDEVDFWEPEEISRAIPGSASSVASDGPASLRSLSGKSDDGSTGPGSLSRLAGLGRAARRQLAAVLDEFWGQLYDLHGQPSPEAKTRKLDLLWADSRFASSPPKIDSTRKEFTGYFPSQSIGGSDPLVNPSISQSPKQPRVQNNFDSSYGVQRGSHWSNMQMLDAYVQDSSHSAMDSAERRYSSLRSLPSSNGWENQPATVHGYQIASIVNRMAKERNSSYLNSQRDSSSSLTSSLAPRNYRESHSFLLGQNLQNELNSPQTSGFQSLAVSRNNPLQSERSSYDVYSSRTTDSSGMSANTKKYHSLPDISGLSGAYRGAYMSEKSNQWDNSLRFGSNIGRTSFEPSFYSSTGSGSGSVGSVAFDDFSKGYGDSFSYNLTSDPGSIWSKQPFEQFGVADKSRAVGTGSGSRSNSMIKETSTPVDPEAAILQSFRCCMLKLLRLEGSDWLFRQNDGVDEDLIDRVAARERCLYEAETREMSRGMQSGDPLYLYTERKSGTSSKNDEAAMTNILVSSIPHCGEGCVWKTDLIVSFGIWCIHRILDLSLMESRPELWGKYTYVLNRLQGIIDPAFSKPRTPTPPCFCLQLSAAHQQQRSSPPSNGMLPPASKPGRGKCTTASMLLDLIKDVEIAISCRKGRSGTAAGDVAFPKGKENLASVLKRYKRRLANKGGK